MRVISTGHHLEGNRVPSHVDDPRLGMPEKALQETVIELATHLKWSHYHTHNSRRSPGGFPDLVLVRQRRILYAELKSTTGRVSRTQSAWLQMLADAGQHVHIWRPIDWITGAIETELRRP